MMPLVFLCLFLYVALVGLCAWRVWHTLSITETAPSGAVSVVVCAHAEQPSELSKCFASIGAALRPADELVVVADGMSDSLLQHLHLVVPRGARVIVNDGTPGKKAAQALGVASASHNHVVCLDADCSVKPSFCSAVAAAMPAQGHFMLLLPVLMQGDRSLFGRMVEMEFVALQVVSAGTALWGVPTMANGAGMAFDRTLYQHNTSGQQYASGDDMFLLQHACQTGASVRFVAHNDALVSTSAPSGLRSYIRQRARWLGKAGGYSSWPVKVVAVVVLLANLLCPLAALRGEWWPMAGKLIADALTYWAGRNLWHSRVPLWVAIPLEALYPVMIATVACRSLFLGRKQW